MCGLFEGQRGNTQAIDKRPRSIKQAELKKRNNEKRFSVSFWKSKATKVNEERYNFYKAKGNIRKTDIYARKLGKV